MSFGLLTAIQVEDVPVLLQNIAQNYRGVETRRYQHLWYYAADLLDEAAKLMHERIEQAKAQGEIAPNRRERVRL